MEDHETIKDQVSTIDLRIYQKIKMKEDDSHQLIHTCKYMYVNVKAIERTNIFQTILKEKIKIKKSSVLLKQDDNTNER